MQEKQGPDLRKRSLQVFLMLHPSSTRGLSCSVPQHCHLLHGDQEAASACSALTSAHPEASSDVTALHMGTGMREREVEA